MQAHVEPAGTAQVQELVQQALGENFTLNVRGAGTKDGFGCTRGDGCNLSMAAVSGILTYEPEELVLCAGAGTPLQEIESTLNAEGQHLAFEPPRLGRLYGNPGDGTLGGAIMGNLAGPRRLVAGAARDHLLGVTGVSGRGELFKSGGRVIKNVTGYDLSKLMAGSWGTLAVATEFWVKVLPGPETSASLVYTDMPCSAGLELLGRIAGRIPTATGLAYIPAARDLAAPSGTAATASLTLIRLEGSPASVNACVNAIRLLGPGNIHPGMVAEDGSRQLWEAVRDVTVLGDEGRSPVILRVSLPPASALSILELLDNDSNSDYLVDQAGGWLWMGLQETRAEKLVPAIRSRLEKIGGSAVLFRAPAALKRRLGVFSRSAGPELELMRRVKQSFDPRNILNPGRLFDH